MKQPEMKWIFCYDRRPSESDADSGGHVVVRIGDRETGYDFALAYWGDLTGDNLWQWLEGGTKNEEEVRFAR